MEKPDMDGAIHLIKDRPDIMTKYYDPNGTYKAYSDDGKNLFSESGEHIGHLLNGFLYDTSGKAIGHVKGKWILDKSGQPIYHTT